ncbi:MAG TPA: dihydrodipicolinate synthase family protein [Blastocatellia bacterium]|jgi:dihydrodipicolinate synthase/N-acetylneuraminate lyase|nr:dihydrodipicolinate synthase family protein [Blastocatellia bacterium]
MKITPVSIEDLRGVFPVPPLARKSDARRSIDFEQNNRIVRHIAGGGLTRFLYGGNAFLYHVTLDEYESLLDWLNSFADGLWAIPSLGPSYGRAMDQASILRRYKFPCAMALPCGDPRDARGLETGLREIAESANTPLILYLKDENNFGADREAGLDVVARLVDEGVCMAIKYAVVRKNPADDAYLESLLKRVDRARVISGIGERPAVVHMRDWRLPGFTTGSGCVAPCLSGQIFEACVGGDYETAEKLRAEFLPLEDLRDAWNPAMVLHFATQLAGVAEMGPVSPFLSSLSEERLKELAPVARRLVERNARG